MSTQVKVVVQLIDINGEVSKEVPIELDQSDSGEGDVTYAVLMALRTLHPIYVGDSVKVKLV